MTTVWKSARTSYCLAQLVVATAMFARAYASTTISTLGSNAFQVDPSISSGPYSQTSGSIIYGNSFVLGDTVGGAFGSITNPVIFDLSSYPAFGLTMALTGGDTYSASFSVELFGFDSDLGEFYTLGTTLQGSTTGIGTNSAIFWLQVPMLDPFDSAVPTPLFSSLTNVAGFQLTWGGSPVSTNTDPVLLSTAIGSLVGAEPEGFFFARSPGGFRFITSSATNGFTPNSNFAGSTNGTILPAGASAWQALSDSNAKTDITAVDHCKTLGKLAKLPVTSWHYKHNPALRHLGPMAQDFRAAFGLGFDDRHVSTLDTDGVALSALKGLIDELQQRRERSAEQSKRLAELEAELRELNEQVESSSPPAP